MTDAVYGTLDEPIATDKSGEPTGNLNEIEMQNLKEMKKRFKLKDLPAGKTHSKKESKIFNKNSRPISPNKKVIKNQNSLKKTSII